MFLCVNHVHRTFGIFGMPRNLGRTVQSRSERPPPPAVRCSAGQAPQRAHALRECSSRVCTAWAARAANAAAPALRCGAHPGLVCGDKPAPARVPGQTGAPSRGGARAPGVLADAPHGAPFPRAHGRAGTGPIPGDDGAAAAPPADAILPRACPTAALPAAAAHFLHGECLLSSYPSAILDEYRIFQPRSRSALGTAVFTRESVYKLRLSAK